MIECGPIVNHRFVGKWRKGTKQIYIDKKQTCSKYIDFAQLLGNFAKTFYLCLCKEI